MDSQRLFSSSKPTFPSILNGVIEMSSTDNNSWQMTVRNETLVILGVTEPTRNNRQSVSHPQSLTEVWKGHVLGGEKVRGHSGDFRIFPFRTS
jgi:hypothetical protein